MNKSMARKDDLEDSLLASKDCSDEERQSLSRRLLTRNVSELCSLAKRLSIKLSGVSKKAYIVERMICMAEFGCIRRPDETTTPDLAGLTYLTEDVRTKLQCLPGFATVTDWSKNWRGVPVHFSLMNLLLYLVCGRDKTFDMQSNSIQCNLISSGRLPNRSINTSNGSYPSLPTTSRS